MKIKSKADAQLRADQIGSFQIELEKIEQENIIALSDSQHSAIAIYHENLLAKLSSTFDIDSNKREKQLSGYIRRLSIGAIQVPLKHRPMFDTILAKEPLNRNAPVPPRYQVQLGYGGRWEPWMISAQLM